MFVLIDLSDHSNFVYTCGFVLFSLAVTCISRLLGLKTINSFVFRQALAPLYTIKTDKRCKYRIDNVHDEVTPDIVNPKLLASLVT